MAEIDIAAIDAELKARGLDPSTGLPAAQTQQNTAQIIPNAQGQQTMLGSLAASTPIQGILGAGDALRHQMTNIANLAPGVNIPYQPLGNPQSLAYTGGELAGNLAGYMGLGAAGGAGLEAAEAIPYVGRAAELLGGENTLAGALRRVGGSTAFGATMSPEDRAKGAELGAVLGGAGETVPYMASGIGKITSGIRPKVTLGAIIDKFGSETAADKAASGSKLYNDIFDRVGDDSIYNRSQKNAILSNVPDTIPSNWSSNERLTPGSGQYTDQFQGLKYTDLPSDQTSKLYDKGLKLLDKKFDDNPSIQNAHSLQSELGGEIRKLNIKEAKLGRLDQSDIGIRDSFDLARSLLQNDIKTYLQSEHPDLLPQYNNANLNWATDVVPHQNAAKIVSDLGQRITPEKTLTAFQKAQDKRVPLPDTLGDYVDKLGKSIKGKEITQKLAGGLLGLSAAQALGPVGEVVGGALGAYAAPAILKSISPAFPVIQRAASAAYNPIRQTTLANVLAGVQ